MNQKILMGCLAILLFVVPARADVPYGVGGFKVGDKIGDHTRQVKMGTAIPIRYQPYLAEVEIEYTPPFKSGLITYGTCREAGQIVRIKLKYADSSEKFFNQLRKRIESRYGKPSEWRGDSFGVFKAWKWSFADKDNNSVSLILQHNTRDDEEKKGNAIKMTMHGLVEEERRCYEEKEKVRQAQRDSKKSRNTDPEELDWDFLIPR